MKTQRWLTIGLTTILLAVSGVMLPIKTPIALALCSRSTAQPFEGGWTNVNTGVRAMIRRVQINFECNDTRSCPIDGPCPPLRPSGFYINPFGSCFPSDCDWGLRYAPTASSGTISTQFNPGFSTREITATIINGGYRNGQLMLTTQTRFTDGSGRPNYSKIEYFNRVPQTRHFSVELTTGSDDLRGGNGAAITLNLVNGTSTDEMSLGGGFGPNSVIRRNITLPTAISPDQIKSVTIRHDGSPRSGHPFDTYDNWDLQRLSVSLTNSSFSPTSYIYNSSVDAPRSSFVQRFTGETRRLVLPRQR